MIKLIFFGIIFGVANIIPGVSGGTMAVVFNLYDKIIYAISHILTDFKNSIKILIPIVLGAGTGIIALASLLSYLLEFHYMITTFFFIGIIIGSIPLIYSKTKSDDKKKIPISGIIAFLLTFGIMIAMMFSNSVSENETIINSITFLNFLWLAFCGAIAAICMIIPGISGSFILVLLGVYNSIINAISDMNVFLLLPVAIGIILGLIFGSKAIEIILKKYSIITYFAILGFVVGSIPTLFFNIYFENAYVLSYSIFIAVFCLIVGVFISYFGTRASK